jgi:hypothetical protein
MHFFKTLKIWEKIINHQSISVTNESITTNTPNVQISQCLSHPTSNVNNPPILTHNKHERVHNRCKMKIYLNIITWANNHHDWPIKNNHFLLLALAKIKKILSMFIMCPNWVSHHLKAILDSKIMQWSFYYCEKRCFEYLKSS